MGKYKQIRIIFAWIVFLGILGFCLIKLWDTDTAVANEEMQVYFLQTKEDADCAVLLQGDTCIVIDTGEVVDGDMLVAFLQEKQVKEISYLVLTHPDKDHIGGAKTLLEAFLVKNLIEPYYPNENEMLSDIYALCNQQNTRRIVPSKNRNLVAGGLVLSLYPPFEKKYGKDNNYSLVVKVKHQDVELLFAGDAIKKRTQELLHYDWGNIEVLKVPYHGRNYQGVGTFLESVNPEIAIVTAKNADNEVTNVCEAIGATIYCTRNGAVALVSDGECIGIEGE